MANLPRQVQEQADNWDEFFKLASGEAPAAPTAAQEPTSQPAGQEPQPQPTSQPQTPPQGQQGNVHDFWQQKYYQDMGSVRAQLQQAQQQIQILQAQMDSRNTEPETPQAPEFRFEGPISSLSEDDVNDIGGSGTVNAVVKIVKEVASKMIAEHIMALRAEIQDTQTTVTNVTKQSHDASILREHKDAAQLFQNEHFVRWLQTQRMPYSHQTKFDRFQEAHENLETQVVIEMLTEFKKFVQQIRDKKSQEMAQSQHVTPTATPQAQNTGTQPTFKASDMQRAQEQYVKGHITTEQFQEIEKKFNAALASGNLVFDA